MGLYIWDQVSLAITRESREVQLRNLILSREKNNTRFEATSFHAMLTAHILGYRDAPSRGCNNKVPSWNQKAALTTHQS
jgi:hypothetical protein